MEAERGITVERLLRHCVPRLKDTGAVSDAVTGRDGALRCCGSHPDGQSTHPEAVPKVLFWPVQ